MTVPFRKVVFALVLVLLCILLVLFVPFLTDPDRLKTVILQQLEDSLGRKIEVGEARLELFPRPRLELTHVIVRDTDPTQVFMKAKRFDVVLRSTPLLRMEVVVKRIAIEEPQVTLRRDQAGQWNFQVPAASAADIRAMGNPLALLLKIQETALTDGAITIIDDYRPDGMRLLEITDLDLAVAAQPSGVPIDLRVSGRIPSLQHTASLTLAGTLTRAGSTVNLGNADPLTDVSAVQFQGTVDLLNVDLRQWIDFFGSRPIPDRIHGLANLRSRLRLVPGVAGYDIVLSEMRATVENLSIAGQANMAGVLTSHPTFSLTLASTPVTLDELLSRFPAQWLPSQLQTILVEREIKGTIEMVSATVTGSTTPAPQASITGEFRIRDGRALFGVDRVQAENLTGTVVLEPDRLRVTEFTGQYGPLHISAGKVAMAYQEQGPSVDVEVTGEMGAADLIGTLSRGTESTQLSTILRDMRNIKGTTRVTFHLAGLLKQTSKLSFISGDIVTQGASFQSPLLPGPVTGLAGHVMYTQTGVEFDRVGGRIGQMEFRVHGKLAIGETLQYQGLTVWAKTDAAQLPSLIPAITLDKSVLQGPLELTLSLTGPFTTPQIKSVLALKDTAVALSNIVRKPAGQPASIEVEGAWSQDKTLSISHIELIMPPARLSGKGTIKFGPRVSFKGSLISGPIPLAALPTGMTIGNMDAGTLEVSLDLKGKGKDWKAWSIRGWIALTDGMIASKKFEEPLTDIYLRMQLLRNGADVKRLEFRVKDSFVRFSGTIRNWHKRPTMDLKVESPNLDLNLLIPKGSRSPVRDMLEDLAATSRVTASVEITAGRYKQFTINDLKGRVNIGDEVLDVNQIAGETEGGAISGHLVVRLPKQKPAEAEIKFQLANLSAEQSLQFLGDQQRSITGDLNLTGTLQGNGRNPHGISNTLNGSVEFQVANGRFEKAFVVPKILTILDIPSRLQGKIDLSNEGMPFDKFTGSFTIRNGIMTTDNILIDSPVLKISGAGSYDIPTDQLDLVVVVSPFGSYTRLLQSIPLFGKLLKGERRGFTTAFFDVKGPMKDPQVMQRPMKSLTAGITGLAQLAADVLINTLKLPSEMIGTNEGTPSPPSNDRTSDKRAPTDLPMPVLP